MIPGFIGAGTYVLCEVDGCDWRLNTDQQGEARWVFLGPTREDFDDAARRYTLTHAAKVERLLREHLESHDVVDFMRTIKRLETDLARQESAGRPRVPTNEVVTFRPADPDPELTAYVEQFWGRTAEGLKRRPM